MFIKTKWISIFDVIIEYSVYGIILSIPFSTAAIETFAATGIFFFLLKETLSFDFRLVTKLENVFILLFFTFCALSMFNSGIYIKKSFVTLAFKWLEYVLIFLLIQDVFKNKARIRNAIFILLVSGGIIGIDGLCQKFFSFEFIRQRALVTTDNGLAAITGPFKHFNDFGAYLSIMLSINIGILLSNKLKVLYKPILYSLMGLLLTCILLTYSRGSWLSFISAISFMCLFSHKKKLPIFLLIIFILLLILLPSIKGRNIVSFNSPTSIVWHDADRFQVWKIAFRMIGENPFIGKGIGTFMDYFSRYMPNLYVQYAHNCYLQIWAEAGIFSLILFLLFIGTVLYKGINKFKEKTDFILLGLIAGLFGFLMHSFFDTNLYSLQLSTLFWVFAGLISAITIEHA